MITLKYQGKKGPFSLNLPFLSQAYVIEGPGAEVVMTIQDATIMIEKNPGMFKVFGMAISPASMAPPGAVQTMADLASKAAAEPPDPPNVAVPSANDILKDDPLDPDIDPDDIPKEPLTGDGEEGDVPLKTPKELQSMTVVELRAYAVGRFNHQFTAEIRRNDILKTIKDLEAKKQAIAAAKEAAGE